MPRTVKITWVDSTTLGILGTKVYRDDIEIADVGNGIQTFDDVNAQDGATYKYEVQAYTSTLESTDETIGVNVETIEISGTIPIITNYVFDGNNNSYMTENSGTLLDGIVNQTWVIRVKRTSNAVQHGLLGCENSATALKLEVDLADDQMDSELNDTGQSTFTNGAVSTDLGWHNYFFFYDGNEIGLYEGNTLLRNPVDSEFIARTSGRILAIGAAKIGGSPEGRLIGEMSDVQFYNKRLSVGEISALNTDLTNTASGLIANFASDKATNLWTSEIGGYVLTNKGTVTNN